MIIDSFGNGVRNEIYSYNYILELKLKNIPIYWNEQSFYFIKNSLFICTYSYFIGIDRNLYRSLQSILNNLQ